MRKSVFSAAVLGLVLAVSAAPSFAQTPYGFINFNPGEADDASAQMCVNVSESGGKVVFNFVNNLGGINGNINQIYFDSTPGLLSNMMIGPAVGTVSFVVFTPPPPLNFPQGNTLAPPFVADFGAGRTGAQANAINPGESLDILFDGDVDDVLAALGNGSLRIGLHVQSIGDDEISDSYLLNELKGGTPPPVPEPGTMGLLAMGAVGLLRRRRQPAA
jgi:hypothetical protein